MNTDAINTLWARRYAALYRVELSVLYHQKRERFFELCDKWAKAVAVIGGSAVMGKVAGGESLIWIAAAITVTSTLSLVFGFSDRSKRHAELVRNFRQLEAEIVAGGESGLDEPGICRWEEKTRQLESQEPPALGGLVVLCQNELAAAASQPNKIVPLSWIQRRLVQFFDFHPTANPS